MSAKLYSQRTSQTTACRSKPTKPAKAPATHSGTSSVQCDQRATYSAGGVKPEESCHKKQGDKRLSRFSFLTPAGILEHRRGTADSVVEFPLDDTYRLHERPVFDDGNITAMTAVSRSAFSRSDFSPFVRFDVEEQVAPQNVAVGFGFCGALPCVNFTTRTGRRRLAQLILMVSLVPVVALVIQNTYSVGRNGAIVVAASTTKGHIRLAIEIGTLIHNLQLERGISALFLSSANDSAVYDSLGSQYRHTVAAIENLPSSGWNLPMTKDNQSQLPTRQNFTDYVTNFRVKVTNVEASVTEVIKFYSTLNERLMVWVLEGILQSKRGETWETMVSYHMLIISKEQAGVERALGSTFFAQGSFIIS